MTEKSKERAQKRINVVPITDIRDGKVYLLGIIKQMTTEETVYFNPKDKEFPNYQKLKEYLDKLEDVAKIVG